MNEEKYCSCKTIGKITTSFDDWCEFDICCNCGKMIKDSYRYLDHYDGEDHVDYDID